jgi:hypothetical protein
MFDPDLLVREPPVAPPQDETRRNLYVLGLPHDYTLSVVFSIYPASLLTLLQRRIQGYLFSLRQSRAQCHPRRP